MPGPYRKLSGNKFRDIPTLSDFDRQGNFIKVTCQHCRISRTYQPKDLAKLCGEIPLYEIAGKFRCSACGKREYMVADLISPLGKDLIGLRVRKLVEIKTVRRPVWTDIIL